MDICSGRPDRDHEPPETHRFAAWDLDCNLLPFQIEGWGEMAFIPFVPDRAVPGPDALDDTESHGYR